MLKENALYKFAEFKFNNLFEIFSHYLRFHTWLCASNESKRIQRSSFWFGSPTESKNHSPSLHQEPSTKQRGDPIILSSFV